MLIKSHVISIDSLYSLVAILISVHFPGVAVRTLVRIYIKVPLALIIVITSLVSIKYALRVLVDLMLGCPICFMDVVLKNSIFGMIMGWSLMST